MAVDLSLECASRVWDELAECLDAFLRAWEAAGDAPPRMAEFIPAGDAVVRRLALEELIKADFEQRARVGCRLSLDEYLRDFPELLVDGEPPAELIHEEMRWRKAAGEKVTQDECLKRFPKSASRLARLFELAPATTSPWRETRSHEQLEAGQSIDDFDLISRVGKGAFASVFLARQRSLQRLVALKVSADRGAEPQTLAQLDHPHIVRVYDQRIVPERRWRLLYMQFAPGGTLQEVVSRVRGAAPHQRTGRLMLEVVDEALQRSGQLAPESSSVRRRLTEASWSETVCRLGVPLAQALDYAHRQGILHRDVKPANVLLTADGSPKLADFNISFAATITGATPAAYFGGSLAYMSPEQLEACHPDLSRKPEELDERSDLYSLAVLLWELLHGERPFRDEQLEAGWTPTLDAMLVRREAPRLTPPPGAPDDRLAERLRYVLCRTLDRDPARRPANGVQFARELYLASQPKAWDAVCGPRQGWREWARRRALLLYGAVILPPNMLGGAFNYWYNEQAIIEPLGLRAEDAFWWIQLVINGVAFPLGVTVLSTLAWSLYRTLSQLDVPPGPTEECRAAARRLALRFGHIVAIVGIVEWLAAGVCFPVSLHLSLGEFPLMAYVHFFFSMLVCGAVSIAFPFFGCTELALRVFYPALLGAGVVEESERRQVLALARQSMGYLLTAAGVPLLGLLMLIGSGSNNRLASLILIGVGLAGMLVAFVSHSRIRRQALTLATATRPAESMTFDTESVEV